MKKMKRGIAGLLAAVLLLGTMACSAPQSREDTVISQIYSDIVALDPARMYDGATMEVLQQVTEGILAQQMDGSMAPYLAETWKAVDETTYVYTMRSDVTFSDETPMTMEDVLFSLQRHRDPAVASYMGWMFENVDTIEQTGDWEFTVKLKQPDATWQYVLGTAAGAVIQKRPARLRATASGLPWKAWWERAPIPSTAGPSAASCACPIIRSIGTGRRASRMSSTLFSR